MSIDFLSALYTYIICTTLFLYEKADVVVQILLQEKYIKTKSATIASSILSTSVTPSTPIFYLASS